MSSYLLPILLVVIFIYCFIKNVPAYDHFVKGAKGAVDLVISIFPYLAAIFILPDIILPISADWSSLGSKYVNVIAYFCVLPTLILFV